MIEDECPSNQVLEAQEKTTTSASQTQPKREMPFSCRLQNKHLQTYTTTHLRGIAKSINLRLPARYLQKWELVHILEFDKKHRHYEIDPSRPSFMNLPGEIRNRIYALCLRGESERDDLQIKFKKGRREIFDGFYFYGPDRIRALQQLSLINHAIRKEARSYFYTNNKFWIKQPLSLRDLPEVTVRFLNDIRADGRASLASLRMYCDTICFVPCTYDIYKKLFSLLTECINLSSLHIFMHIECFLAETQRLPEFWTKPKETRQPELRAYLAQARYSRGPLPALHFDDFLNLVEGLKKLRTLHVHLILEHMRWKVGPEECFVRDFIFTTKTQLEKALEERIPEIELHVFAEMKYVSPPSDEGEDEDD